MKRNILSVIFLCFISIGIIYAQVPQAFNYQAVARDKLGNLLENTEIGIEVIIHEGSSSGTIVYTEIFVPKTNKFGLFTLQIGLGARVTGNFSTINWSTGDYWLQVLMDPTAGTSYTDMGTSQLLSVPFAMYAANSGNQPRTR